MKHVQLADPSIPLILGPVLGRLGGIGTEPSPELGATSSTSHVDNEQ